VRLRAALCASWLLLGCVREEVDLLDRAPTDGAAAGHNDATGARGGQCGGSSYRAVNKALEILLLVDASGSAFLPAGLDCFLTAAPASCRLAWEVATSEIGNFVNDARSAGISLALKYFGSSCEPRDYQIPDVPMGQLPEHAPAVSQSLLVTLPLADTATRPALEGGLAYARQRSASAGYNARMIIVLLADFGPDEQDCANNNIAALTDVAASGSTRDPAIPTYVFVTTRSTELDQVARAGGTERSIMADLAQTGALSSALNSLRDRELAGLPCEYMLPAAYFERVKDPSLVNLRRDGVALGRVRDPSACSEAKGGWYYDDPTLPSRILTCPGTCSALRSGGSVDIQLDCPTFVLY
jgi:hypothetical protein